MKKNRRNLFEVVLLLVIVAVLVAMLRPAPEPVKEKPAANQPKVDLVGQLLDFSASYGMGTLMNAVAEPGAAEELLTRHIEENPEDWKGYFQRGNARLKYIDYEGAISDFDMAARLNQSNHRVHNNLAYALALHGDYQAAVRTARRAQELAPDYALGHATEGFARLGLDDNNGALNAFEKALELDTTSLLAAWGAYEAASRMPEAPQQLQNQLLERAQALGGQPWIDWPATDSSAGTEQYPNGDFSTR